VRRCKSIGEMRSYLETRGGDGFILEIASENGRGCGDWLWSNIKRTRRGEISVRFKLLAYRCDSMCGAGGVDDETLIYQKHIGLGKRWRGKYSEAE
jgi:hypothetical protein